jgi:redox-sensitive bicupin YhaK (pirin superfamily)
MKIILHRSDERGKGEYGWLTTRYSFSFADWYDASKMGFGALRVLNDDIIAPLQGFGKHGHKNMEIITVVTRGEVTHQDSMGNSFKVKAGDVQVMSAGTGVLHSESNDSAIEPLELFQIWIEPQTYNIEPRYEQKSFDFQSIKNSIVPLVHKENALRINQEASIFYGAMDSSESLIYTLQDKDNGVYLFIIGGEVVVGGETLKKRDALGISEIDTIKIQANENSQFLIIEVPMKQ